MEVFVDFGLFELLAVLGLAALARVIYSRRWLGVAFVLASLVGPATLLVVSKGETMLWLAAGSLATALVNATVVLGAIQRGSIPIFRIPKRPREGVTTHDPEAAAANAAQIRTRSPSR